MNDATLAPDSRSPLDKPPKIGIVGLGYVGLPLLLRCAERKVPAVGFDIDESKITSLQHGRSYIRHIGDDKVSALNEADVGLTASVSDLAHVDAILICVPTPLNANREPDLSFVTSTMTAILPHLQAGQLIVLESTTYPGTTEELVADRIAKQGFEIGREIYVGYSPEREDPGNASFKTATIPKLVSGVTPACCDRAVEVYSQIIDSVVPVKSTRVAEMAKLLENIHRAVNIGLVNEMKMAADSMGIDIHEVIDAAASKPFGFTAYRPGPGIGGHCIPIDPFYLTWKAREYGVNTRFVELAGEVNSAMPDWVIQKVVKALNEQGKAVKGSKIMVLGMAYKKNIDDLRMSPSLYLLERLRSLGADFCYHDPHVPVFPKLREHSFDLASVPLTDETLASMDCIILSTDHDSVDYLSLLRKARLIVDTRGRFARDQANVIRA